MMTDRPRYIRWFDDLGWDDVAQVGGKNASLGELASHLRPASIRVADGFAITAAAFRDYLKANGFVPRISRCLADLADGRKTLHQAGQAIRLLIVWGKFPPALVDEIYEAYRELSRRFGLVAADVAVRSSATAEDLPEASFAGQHESYLNVVGEEALLEACHRCFASLFTDRAIAYRRRCGFDHLKVALSVGVQKMVRSDLAGSGVMFTLDPDTGFPRTVVINASWGLGENVVKGLVTPDEYHVFKPLLGRSRRPIISRKIGEKETKLLYSEIGRTRQVNTTPEERTRPVLADEEILCLAQWADTIERHYRRPMDIEWAKDGGTGELFILQARPETVHSQKDPATFTTYEMLENGRLLLEGAAVGSSIASGSVAVLRSLEEQSLFPDGGILVTAMTDPDWLPVMKRAAGIVTDHGGRTSHAAIVSRELGLPAVIGTGVATKVLVSGQPVTLSCASGDRGRVYEGCLRFGCHRIDLNQVPKTRTKLMINLANPDAALRWWKLPTDGVGLARMEFIISSLIRVHPLALTRFDQIPEGEERCLIERLTAGFPSKEEYFVETLALGISRIASAFYPRPVIVRLSDFKTNEYAGLIGGRIFEPQEENPMLGFRGASRYYSDRYLDGFVLECSAIRRVREEIGLENVIIMVPFCRTPHEADQVLEVMARNGLRRHTEGLKVYVMIEIPSNVILADQFAARFDGFSIGSNDLTQLVLGVDRDSEILAPLFDERDDAVKAMMHEVIHTARRHHVPVGICGQAPGDYPEIVRFLVEAGISSISVNPDSVIRIRTAVAEEEKRLSRAIQERALTSPLEIFP